LIGYDVAQGWAIGRIVDGFAFKVVYQALAFAAISVLLLV
jgi:hypothetical protein